MRKKYDKDIHSLTNSDAKSPIDKSEVRPLRPV